MKHLDIRTPRSLYLVCIALLGFSFAATAGNVKRLSEPVETDQFSETFGARFVVKGETLGLKKAVKDSDCEQGKNVTVKTKVSEVCQAKGCFFIASEDDFYTRVTFQDYNFFVPTDISGKEVVMNAVLKPRILSDEEIQHMQDDLSTSTIAKTKHNKKTKSCTSLAKGPICELTAQSVKVFN
ncbi:MAG: DUF4920 domain-containing protein [Arenicella sp.]|jgi:hypothetical protein|nr:DUF4920 domain-containing protein [Arenicella sp.]